MRYIFDNDLHIHSKLSLCSNDPAESTEAILEYGLKNSLKTICLTDHYWDETVPGAESFGFYSAQDYAHIAAALPLPKAYGIKFLFGCETELKRDLTLGISKESFDRFDFVIIPTTHLHMGGFTCRGDEDASERAKLWIERFDALLDMELPFHKIGIAHLTCPLIYSGENRNYIDVLDCIPDAELTRIFTRARESGIGIELNFDSSFKNCSSPESELRIYRTAKECGCKFYFGSDAHHPATLDYEKENAERIIDLLGLEESDKFILK